MSVKIILVFCTQALLIQSSLSKYASRAAITTTRSIPAAGTTPVFNRSWGCGYITSRTPAYEITPTSGGLLPITSAPVLPSELVLASENEYEGVLSVTGELPFVGTVGFDGKVPSAGKGIVNHACGNGPARITSVNVGRVRNLGITPVVNGVATTAVNIAPRPLSYGYRGVLKPTYGGNGEGNVVVSGEIPVAGEATVAGQVPIMGSVHYLGVVPAAGRVSISAVCDCSAF